jgi:hypothetical protein
VIHVLFWLSNCSTNMIYKKWTDPQYKLFKQAAMAAKEKQLHSVSATKEPENACTRCSATARRYEEKTSGATSVARHMLQDAPVI